MASETITRNDLKAILNEVLPPTPSEYKKLLWTNPSPTSSFSAQTILSNVDLTEYDEVEIYVRRTSSETGIVQVAQASASYGASIGGIWGADTLFRKATVSVSGIQFTDGYYNGSVNNTYMIPYTIYGIKYGRVSAPQIEIEETFNNVEAVTSFPYTPSHSGILTLYILQNGTSAVWRSARITDQTTNTHTDFGVYFAGTTYGGASCHLPVIKGHTYIVASGASDLYFEASRSYLTY
jgi:hypothetical protein